jgi:hypothetical protein
MGIKENLAPLVDEVIANMPSNEFTTYEFMMAFSRFQERAYVEALHASLNHPGGPFTAVKEALEALLEASPRASLLRDGARAIDIFGLAGITKMWQQKR